MSISTLNLVMRSNSLIHSNIQIYRLYSSCKCLFETIKKNPAVCVYPVNDFIFSGFVFFIRHVVVFNKAHQAVCLIFNHGIDENSQHHTHLCRQILLYECSDFFF